MEKVKNIEQVKKEIENLRKKYSGLKVIDKNEHIEQAKKVLYELYGESYEEPKLINIDVDTHEYTMQSKSENMIIAQQIVKDLKQKYAGTTIHDDNEHIKKAKALLKRPRKGIFL